ncbi:hypothetical protein ACFLRB_02440 [Acidobacteriota bacterium]
MSSTRDSIKIFEKFSEKFIHEFDFYLDALDEIYRYQSAIGLTQDELASNFAANIRPRLQSFIAPNLT